MTTNVQAILEEFAAKLAARPVLNPHTLPAGFHDDPFDSNAAINITDYEGVLIAHQWDKRGPDSDFWYDLITIEIDGEEHQFNCLDDAHAFIREYLDLGDVAEDHEEHRLRSWQLV